MQEVTSIYINKLTCFQQLWPASSTNPASLLIFLLANISNQSTSCKNYFFGLPYCREDSENSSESFFPPSTQSEIYRKRIQTIHLVNIHHLLHQLMVKNYAKGMGRLLFTGQHVPTTAISQGLNRIISRCSIIIINHIKYTARMLDRNI